MAFGPVSQLREVADVVWVCAEFVEVVFEVYWSVSYCVALFSSGLLLTYQS